MVVNSMNDRNLKNTKGKWNNINSSVNRSGGETNLSRRIIKDVLVKGKNAGVSRHFFISFRDLLF